MTGKPDMEPREAGSENSISGRKGLLFGCLTLLAFGLVIPAVVGEVGLRMFWDGYYEKGRTKYFEIHPVVGWINAPNFSGTHGSPEFIMHRTHNSRGFRGEEFSDEQIQSSSSVAILGDSLVYGHGANDEDTFTYALNRDDTERVYLNMGVSSFATAQEYLLLKEIVTPLKPDLVVFCVFWNDIFWDVFDNKGPTFQVVDGKLVQDPLDYETLKSKAFFAEADPDKVLFGKSYLYRFVSDRIKIIKDRMDNRYKDDFNEELEKRTEESWTIVRALIEAARDHCESNGMRFLLVYIPDQVQVEVEKMVTGFPKNFKEIPTRLATIADELQLPYFDATECLQSTYDPDGPPYYFPVDRHFTREGHQAMAKCLRPVIESQLGAAR